MPGWTVLQQGMALILALRKMKWDSFLHEMEGDGTLGTKGFMKVMKVSENSFSRDIARSPLVPTHRWETESSPPVTKG